MTLNRRTFFGALLAPFIARFVPKPIAPSTELSLSMDEFSARYIQPAAVAFANRLDADVIAECKARFARTNAAERKLRALALEDIKQLRGMA